MSMKNLQKQTRVTPRDSRSLDLYLRDIARKQVQREKNRRRQKQQSRSRDGKSSDYVSSCFQNVTFHKGSR